MLSPVAPSRRAGRTPVWRMPTIRPEWTRTRSWPVRVRLLAIPNEVPPATLPRPDDWLSTSFDHTSLPLQRSPSELKEWFHKKKERTGFSLLDSDNQTLAIGASQEKDKSNSSYSSQNRLGNSHRIESEDRELFGS